MDVFIKSEKNKSLNFLRMTEYDWISVVSQILTKVAYVKKSFYSMKIDSTFLTVTLE